MLSNVKRTQWLLRHLLCSTPSRNLTRTKCCTSQAPTSPILSVSILTCCSLRFRLRTYSWVSPCRCSLRSRIDFGNGIYGGDLPSEYRSFASINPVVIAAFFIGPYLVPNSRSHSGARNPIQCPVHLFFLHAVRCNRRLARIASLSACGPDGSNVLGIRSVFTG